MKIVSFGSALVLLAGLLAPGTVSAQEDDAVSTYTNPVSAGFTENFADPTIIRGHDGFWYAYGTNGKRYEGDVKQNMMISKSADLIDWEWVGPVFTPETIPTYDGKPPGANRQFWAPEIAYLDGRYVLYYSYVVQAPGTPWRTIAAATAEHPAGPWTDTGEVVVGNETWEVRPGVTEIRNNIDPELLTAPDGTRYMYYGSVQGGVRVVELSADGLHADGEPVQLTDAHRYEAPYVVNRDGFYYLFLSVIGGCCAGAASGYPIMVGRSTDPTGPFLDRDGHSLNGPQGGGTPVLAPNGNEFVSTGHNAIATDLSGQDWIVSHAIDRFDPYVSGTESARGLALTRLDWIDGWPIGNGGAGMPSGPTEGPDNNAFISDAFEGDLSGWMSADGWAKSEGPTGGYAHADSDAPLTSIAVVNGDLRVRALVRLAGGGGGEAGISIPAQGRHSLTASIDRESAQLTVKGQGNRTTTAPLPVGFNYETWHEIEIVVSDGSLRVAVSESGQYDPVAEVTLRVPNGVRSGQVALQAKGIGADFDDVTVARLFTPETDRVPDPMIGAIDSAYSDEFEGELAEDWSWLREPAATVDDGGLDFEIQRSTLINQRPQADILPSLLLRDMPPGTWTAETKVTIPFGDSIPYGWPQAGLIAYTDDDEWVELAYTTRESRRFTAFAKETASAGTVAYGHAALGPSRDTMWLRLQHTVGENGEHLYRAAVSIDGEQWTWHGTRTLPAGPQPKVGLVAQDLAQLSAQPGQASISAQFEWFRTYR
ncbi:family 43 glycosylhydrolase [Microbacterium murale]|uniref:Regulation of enolase protein 1 (Concanavalin A-like superfamily) n=1 Tax=Microbacterium murale TaxID=1081040 RepID=A0ABU0PA61_9MICO|nr:family 43 glycosylhydrolase [Microbacterium murale]MDQ0643509.1 regulation of enolase protein 1 (concanavalin A-like superfamily) [Microbacterium murale]